MEHEGRQPLETTRGSLHDLLRGKFMRRGSAMRRGVGANRIVLSADVDPTMLQCFHKRRDLGFQGIVAFASKFRNSEKN